MPPFAFVLIAAGIVAGWTAWRAFALAKKEPLSDVHEAIYQGAVKHVTDPAKLQKLGDAFAQQGKPLHAAALNSLADVHAKKPGKPKKAKPKKKLVQLHPEELKLAGQPAKPAMAQSTDQPLNPPPPDAGTPAVGVEK